MTFSPTPALAAALTGREALLAMLTYKRPGGSKAETAWIKRFIAPHVDYADGYGNLIKCVGKDPTTLFAAHTDTVHRKPGPQTVEISEDGWAHSASGDCLGADCAAGVWLMLEMIRAEVPGLYVFHREEESGGGGSSYIARKTPWLLDGIQVAIAFDRKGFSSVITHQFGERCCSDAFAGSLGAILGGEWHRDDGGTFTDTANYVELVAECTNLSVGYLDQHTPRERQHIPFLMTLRDCLVAADWSALTIKRKPGEREWPADWRGDYHHDSDSQDFHPRRQGDERLAEAITDHLDVVMAMLGDLGITADDILDAAYR